MLPPELLASLGATNHEAIHDYLDSLADLKTETERLVAQLNKAPEDSALIHALFRALHSVKSNAAMCRLQTLVDFAHPMEDIVGAVRSTQLPYLPEMGELLLLGLDRIELAATELAHQRSLDHLAIPSLVEALLSVAQSQRQELGPRLGSALQCFSGHGHPDEPLFELELSNITSNLHEENSTFFRRLVQQMERRVPFWEGRFERNLALALNTNEQAGNPVDPMQLEVAIYMHDIGMAFLPDTLWSKQGKFNELEVREMRMHPILAAGLLQRMHGWEEAARMVLEHHERPDGTGYPQGLKGEQISLGARLLGLLDAFEAMTHERGDRYHKRSILRAVTEINACEGQFDRFWVVPFNRVARRLIEQQGG